MSRVQEWAEDDVLDEAVVEALLSGSVDPAVDPSSSTARLARLLAEVRSVDRSEPMAGEVAIRALYRREFNGAGVSSGSAPIPLYGPKLSRRVGRRAAALGAILTLGASGVAAAAGVLPGPVQRRAHDTLAMVGVSVPDGRPGGDQPSGPDSDGDQVSPGAEVTSTGAVGDQGSGDAGSPANRKSTDSQGDGSGVPDGHGAQQGRPADPNPGSPADPNPGSPADPNHGSPANPNAGGPGVPDTGGPANPNAGGPGSTGRPADPNAGGFANSGGMANPNPGGSANPNAGGRGEPAGPANPNSGRPANPGK